MELYQFSFSYKLVIVGHRHNYYEYAANCDGVAIKVVKSKNDVAN
ncbi:MAG: hypothetical protein WCF67_09770 [Chitinophagaceae bacterium]